MIRLHTRIYEMRFTNSARENNMRIDSWFIRRSNPNVAISRSWRFYLPLWVLKTWRRQFWCMHENQMWIVEHLCAAFVLSILLGGNVHAASLPIHRLRVTPCDRAWSAPPRKGWRLVLAPQQPRQQLPRGSITDMSFAIHLSIWMRWEIMAIRQHEIYVWLLCFPICCQRMICWAASINILAPLRLRELVG